MLQTRETISTDSSTSQVPGMYDPLTDLYNKTLFIQVMESLLRISVRQHMPVSLVIVNIDNFDEMHEKYGLHEANAVLKQCADLIKATSRDSDVLAHFEDEKFALLLYNCSYDSSQIAINRLLHNIEKQIKIGEEQIPVSIGIATFGERTVISHRQTLTSISENLISEALSSLEEK